MVAELRLDRALDLADRGAEHHGVEFLDHLATAEGAQVAAVAAGRAAGVFLRHLGEVGAVLDGGLQFVGLGFGRDQDVAGGGFCHERLLAGNRLGWGE